MPDGSEFHTVGAATLKPREANVVRTRGMDSRLYAVKMMVVVIELVTLYFLCLFMHKK